MYNDDELPRLLTQEELIDLTGAKSAKKQREILDRFGVTYIVRLDGKVRTTWAEVVAKRGTPSTTAAPTPKSNPETEPDFSKLIKHNVSQKKTRK